MPRFLCLMLTLAALACSSFSQKAHLPAGHNMMKAENGLVIAWKTSSEDSAASQIGVYEMDGKPLVSLTPLQLVPEARNATVSDVSALRGHIIAVAAVFSEGNDRVPAASLLFFDFQGSLRRALALDSSREIMRLTIDADSNVWALTTGAGGQNPSEAPMVVGYRPSGEVFRNVFKRSEFPLHASLTQENPETGAPGFGHMSNGIWLWLSGSTDLITFRPDGSSIKRLTTALPRRSSHEEPIRVLLTDGGRLIAQVMGRQNNVGPGHLDFFSWSESTAQWQPFYPSCGECILVGTDGDLVIFAKPTGNGFDIEVTPKPW